MGFFVSRHLGLLLCNIAIMKRFLPLFILSSFLFGQDVLTLKNGESYKGTYIGKVGEDIVFKVEGEKSTKKFPIWSAETIVTKNGELTYPFDIPIDILTKQEYPSKSWSGGYSIGYSSEKIAISFYNFSLKRKKSFSFPNIEYRITDVTEVDSNGKFWALNFFWPGEKKLLKPSSNSLLNKMSEGSTHQQFDHVERLIEFKIEGNNVIRTNSAPIYLELNKNSRNWEGLVRMNKNGFILIVDEHPRTILAYLSKKK